MEWKTWQDFVLDRRLEALGLQVVPGRPDANVLVFSHRGCGSTVSVLASRLRHLLADLPPDDLPVLRETAACSGHCDHLGDLSLCDNRCANARDRRLALLTQEIKARGSL
jgi:hypothetical protein